VSAAPRLLSPLSRQFAACLARLDPQAGPAVLQAAWLASEAVADGDVCVDLVAWAGQRCWNDALSPGVVFPELDEWENALRASCLTGAPGEFAPLILDGRHRLYLARYWHYESLLATDLLARAAAPSADLDEERLHRDLDQLFASNAGEGPDWQKRAAATAVRQRLCVISGGPGTGKTTTVVRLQAALQMHYRGSLVIRLAAPTGKAAARMQEAVRGAKGRLAIPPEILAVIPEQAGTLHRLLGARPDSSRFRHGRDNRLPLDVLVVDEASMIDLALMAKLVEALPPHARLILLGDKDQLSSVEAGAVFGDICAGGEGGLAASIALLHKSYRFDAVGGIGKLARAVRDGEADGALELLAQDGSPDFKWIVPTGSDDLRQLLLEGYREYGGALRERAAPEMLFDHFGRFRALCAHREGPSGVTGLNTLLEDALRREGIIPPRETWYYGRPVMVTRNDYNLMLFNGDVGIVAERDGERRVFFQGADGQLRDFAPGWLPQHETVFAMTVHKSQGSEFEHVLLALPDESSPALNRALVYTAITRAKRRIILRAGRDILARAIATQAERVSGLTERLRG